MLDERLFEDVRSVLTQSGAIPALRAGLFLFGVLAAFAWLRQRPLRALSLVSVGGFLGLGWWLIQIATPMGFGADELLTRAWAQAGVNALAGNGSEGFVRGTPGEVSVVSTLALMGMPLRLIHLVPQFAVLLSLVLSIALPLAIIRNPTTAMFGACLIAGGGLWPGVSVYPFLLLRPSLCLVLASAFLGVVALSRSRPGRRLFKRHRVAMVFGLVTAATAMRAWSDGAVSGAGGAALLVAVSLVLASPLRAALRRASLSTSTVRRLEALCLLGVFCGSGLFWWTPPRTVAGFLEATDPNLALRRPLAWIAQNVPIDDVVFSTPDYSAGVAALAGHRVLFPPSGDLSAESSLSEPFRRKRLAESILRGQPIARLAGAFSVTHLFLGPGEASPAPTEAQDPDKPAPLSLVLVYEDAEDFRVFRFTKK